MWNAALPNSLLEESIKQSVNEAPVSFVRLIRTLPQMRGTEDLELRSGLVLWRGLSTSAVAALERLHGESEIFFWLCPPSIYFKTDDAPFLRLVSSACRAGEQVWLPTLIFNRAPSALESRKAVGEYVAELARSPNAAH